MAWCVHTGTQVQNLIATIKTDLEANGWTLTDRAADQVWNSTNNQGAANVVQITNLQNNGTAGSGAAWQYLQFQTWQSWNTGTHAGLNGSGTTLHRLYYAAANVADVTTVDLYLSVNANRVIVYINGANNYRNWAYVGGLDSLGGTSDPNCVLLLTSYEAGNSYDLGAILQAARTPGVTYWSTIRTAVMALVNDFDTLVRSEMSAQPLGYDITQAIVYPVLICDSSPLVVRGNLDGIVQCPLGSAYLTHMSVVNIGGTNYLVVLCGGSPNTNSHPLSGAYVCGIAIAEV